MCFLCLPTHPKGRTAVLSFANLSIGDDACSIQKWQQQYWEGYRRGEEPLPSVSPSWTSPQTPKPMESPALSFCDWVMGSIWVKGSIRTNGSGRWTEVLENGKIFLSSRFCEYSWKMLGRAHLPPFLFSVYTNFFMAISPCRSHN